MDPETEFLTSKKQTGNEWELYKENVRPLKRGRDVGLLNDALKSQQQTRSKKSLLEKRRRLIDAIDEYRGEDPLLRWIECIKWVQESFPAGGDYSGLVVIYEQCVRTFWHDDKYKEDPRYLRVWLEYAESCNNSEIIYRFLDANQIGQTQSGYYLSYALQMESKNKLTKADEIFNLGIARKAQPLRNLESAYRKFLIRSAKKGGNNIQDEDAAGDAQLHVRSFGTVLTAGEARIQLTAVNNERKKARVALKSVSNTPLCIYDENIHHQQSEVVKKDPTPWRNLGAQADRNKENNLIHSRWTSHKIPQKTSNRMVPSTSSACIEVFVDEECAESMNDDKKTPKPSTKKLRKAGGGKYTNKDIELLKEDPLRNFPINSLPR